MSAAGLPIWVVYDHPNDFPNIYVARLWVGLRATEEFIVSPDLEGLRDVLIGRGLVKLDRMEGDDPAILETWL